MFCCIFFGDWNWFFNYDFFFYRKWFVDGDFVYNWNVMRDWNLKIVKDKKWDIYI